MDQLPAQNINKLKNIRTPHIFFENVPKVKFFGQNYNIRSLHMNGIGNNIPLIEEFIPMVHFKQIFVSATED